MPHKRGPSLIEQMDLLKMDEKSVESPLRLIVGDRLKDFNTTTYSGKVLVGAVAPGHVLRCMPQNIMVQINNVRLETDDTAPGSTAGAKVVASFWLFVALSSKLDPIRYN